MSSSLRQLWDKAWESAETRVQIRGRLGRKNIDGSYSMAVPVRKNFFYVTLSIDGSQTVDIARVIGVPRLYNLPVIMRRKKGNLVVVGLDIETAVLDVYMNGGVSFAPPHTHNEGSGLEYEIQSKWISPGRVLWSSGVTIRIRPFFFRYNHTEKYFAGGTLDLTSNLPPTSTKWAWIVVGINPLTNAAVAVTGAEQTTQADLTDALIANVDMLDHIPLCAIQAKNGDTSLSIIDRYRDARHWLDERFRLDDLTNVSVTSISDNQILTYDSATGKWINEVNLGDVAAAIHAAILKAIPHDDDEFGYSDSEGLWSLKKLSWANIKAALTTLFNTLYAAIGHTHSFPLHSSTHKHGGDDEVATATPAANAIPKAGAGGNLHIDWIANNAVTLDKIQQIQTQRLLGRNTAAAGNVEELSALPTNIDALYALLGGRAGGQTLSGGNASGNNLILNSTSHATKGETKLANDGGQVTIRRSAAGAYTLHIGGSGVNPADLAVESNAGRKFLMRAGDTSPFTVFGLESDHSFSIIQNNIERIRFAGATNAGRLGIFGLGVIPFNPQGGMHFHDGTTGWMMHTISVSSGTSVTVIPDGTGDVTVALNCEFALKPSTGAGLSGSRVNVQPGGGDQSLWDTGTDILVIRVTAGGAIQVQRTAGTLTYTVSLHLFWQ